MLFSRFDVDDRPDELEGLSVGEALLKVHRSYLKAIQTLVKAGLAVGFSHVTGGGLEGNTRRILPDGLGLDVDYTAWERPALFRLIEEVGGVPEDDLRRTFNLGIGLVAVVAAGDVEAAVRTWTKAGEEPVVIGRVVRAA